jgi:hypothetical protein
MLNVVLRKLNIFYKVNWADYEVFYQPSIVELLGILARTQALVGAEVGAAFRFVIDGVLLVKTA